MGGCLAAWKHKLRLRIKRNGMARAHLQGQWKSGTPYHHPLLTDWFTNWFNWFTNCSPFVCVCTVLGAWKSSLMAKGLLKCVHELIGHLPFSLSANARNVTNYTSSQMGPLSWDIRQCACHSNAQLQQITPAAQAELLTAVICFPWRLMGSRKAHTIMYCIRHSSPHSMLLPIPASEEDSQCTFFSVLQHQPQNSIHQEQE